MGLSAALGERTICVDGSTYEPVSRNEFSGYYDWLLEANRLFGIRFWQHEELDRLAHELQGLPYVRVADDGMSIDLLLRRTQGGSVTSKRTQEYGCNFLYYSKDLCEYAISFDIRWFGAVEMTELSAAEAESVDVQPHFP